jgi:glycerol-3-phosphate O-acyltransferase
MISPWGRLWALWARASLQPADIAEHLNSEGPPVCYVLERRSGIDAAVLRATCIDARLPRPTRRLPAPVARGARAWFALECPVGFWRTRIDRRTPPELLQLLQALRADPALDLRLVPVAVYWGRAPQKEHSLIRLILSDDWVIGSRLRRLFALLINSRRGMVQFGAPVPLRSLLEGSAEPALAARRVMRHLRLQLARARAARIGPDLSHRRTIVARVLQTRMVRAAVAAEVLNRNLGPGGRRAVLEQAREYGLEIAANYSHAFVSSMSRLLTGLWNRLYDGVEVRHIETLQQVADGNEIVYVPCHRSHMDYLLLSYSIYHHGFAIPHIAAGLNLNMPVIGRFLRKGGAFFIRRSFRGNALYTAVVTKYLGVIMARGHSIEYFIEGGRSRTGRLLTPATGMLTMTVRSYLREPRRPVVFVPVYFGYERVLEGSAYVSELSGKPKEKESVLGFFRAMRRLREHFGRVHVNFGEPIHLDAMLERHAPGWRQSPAAELERPRWTVPLVNELAMRIMQQINAAAAVTPVNLLALALLATPRQATLESDLLRQIETLLAVLRGLPYSERVTITTLTPAQIIDYGIGLQIVTRERQKSGEFVRMSPESTVLATYYRNNVLHMMAVPSLVACCFLGNAALRTADLQRLGMRIYPYIAAELFLYWPEAEVDGLIERTLAALAALGLLEHDTASGLWRRPAPTSVAALQLSLLAQCTVQTIERYYLAIALLIRAGSGTLSQKMLEERCQLMAQRMTLLYGFNSPEFFDRALFVNYLDLLRERQVIRTDASGCLCFDEVLLRVASDAELVLSEQIRHSILQVTHG